MALTEPPRPCFACGHLHDPESPGACWEAACHPDCRETEDCPLPNTPRRCDHKGAGWPVREEPLFYCTACGVCFEVNPDGTTTDIIV